MSNVHLRFLKNFGTIFYRGHGSRLGNGALRESSVLPGARPHQSHRLGVVRPLRAHLSAFLAAAATHLARWHFWVSNVGALLLVVGIAGINAGYSGFIPLAGTGSVATLPGAIIFAIILYRHLGPT